ARAGIAGRHRDGRRNDIRILRHRQGEERNDADEDDEDGDDIRQDRPLDEELGDHCAVSPASAASSTFICGSIFWPGTAVIRPETMILSSAVIPEVTTRRLPTSWPIWMPRCSTMSSFPATST